MTIDLTIYGVDGEGQATIITKNAASALEFLKKHDHEGSSLTLTIDAESPEDVYEALQSLQPMVGVVVEQGKSNDPRAARTGMKL